MFRIGQSSDIHPLVKGRKLILGGVEIESELGLDGHSDGDALSHAIAESIIGALGEGDLGKHFSDQDIKFKDICSLRIVEQCAEFMYTKGYQINNIDALIMIEKPKMAPYIEAMKKNIAKALQCDISLINIKATRGEKLGYVGREEGVLAQAVVLLVKK
ncbi:MAG: 2-C-methyl-D-erythritol 2,4-cyclodiphosphate synthase [Erysipelotrichaceae bacterium]